MAISWVKVSIIIHIHIYAFNSWISFDYVLNITYIRKWWCILGVVIARWWMLWAQRTGNPHHGQLQVPKRRVPVCEHWETGLCFISYATHLSCNWIHMTAASKVWLIREQGPVQLHLCLIVHDAMATHSVIWAIMTPNIYHHFLL